jgi:hypothetical protein
MDFSSGSGTLMPPSHISLTGQTRGSQPSEVSIGNTIALGEPLQVRLIDAVPDLEALRPSFAMTVKNEGPPIPLLVLDVEFRYPPPEGSLAEYTPVFESVDLEEFKGNEVRTVVVESQPLAGCVPTLARIVPPGLLEEGVRATTGRIVQTRSGPPGRGTLFFGGKVEVVDIKAEFTSDSPRLSFTLENVGTADVDESLESIRYVVQLYKGGTLVDLGRRFTVFKPVPGSLGRRGSKVTFSVSGIESARGLAGARPVLRLRR